ncbi:MAG TPA: adenylate/guanylate cyclase domain-containing protein [Acidobacteriota bacterium]
MSHATCSLVYDLGQGPIEKKLSRNRVVLGRGADCDVVLTATAVSRRHAAMELSGGVWQVSDLASLNGVFVNGQRITTRALQDNDRIKIGSVDLTYRLLAAGETWVGDTRVVVKPSAGSGLGKGTTRFWMGDFDPVAAKAVSPDSKPGEESRGEPGPRGSTWLMDLLSDATECIVTSDTLDDMLRGLLEVAMSTVPAERGAILLHSPETGTLVPRAARVDFGDPDAGLVISEALTDEVLAQQSSVLVADATGDQGRHGASLRGENVGSVMCAPFFRHGESTGLIYLDSRQGGAFEQNDLRVLSSLGIIAAIGVQQVSLRALVTGERKRRERLQRYLPHDVVDSMLAREETTHSHMLTSEREVTVLFCDLHKFTRIAESLAPAEVAALLNGIFDELTQIVFELNGTLDKFTGDGLVAFFGAPFEQEDHARRAVLAAMRMRDAIARLDEEREIEFPLRMRFGINSGKVIAGDIGAAIRCDYTVLGDVVNVASRLESTVAQPGEVVIGAATRALLDDEFECEELAEATIRGRVRTEHPFRVVGVGGAAAPHSSTTR